MTYEEEIKSLKKQYKEKIAEFERNKNPEIYRDSNGSKEYKIDVWFLKEINKLKKKYNVD